MTLKHRLEIPPEDPFKFDKLKREEEAKTLAKLVKNYADGFVLALNNEWGAGKTTFVKMWQAHLKKEGVESLYFNAWENDYQDDVLVALLSELSELKDDEKVKFKEVVKNAAPIAGKAVLGALKGLVATYGLDKVLQGAIDGALDGSEDLLKSEIDAYSKRKDGVKDFQKSLEEYAKAVSGENPLVFIIDELDRCRPSYAVEVLEQIKHIFSVPGIVFVLAIDKVQLGHAVKGVYGSPGMDDVEYLRRFIDVEFTLPRPSLREYVDYSYDYFGLKALIESLPLSDTSNTYVRDFRKYVISISKVFDLNLRQVEGLIAHLKITISTYSLIPGLNPSISILLTVLRLKKYDLYKSIRDVQIGEQELIDELDKIFPPNLDDQGWTIAILSYIYNNELKFKSKNPGDLIIESKDGVKNLRLNYGKFSDGYDYKKYFENLNNNHTYYDLRTGRILSNLELTRKYFQQ